MKRKITIKNLNDSIDIIIDKVKFVCGNDYESRDKIKKVLVNRFNKLSESEYSEDIHKSEVLLDDEPIVINDYLFFCIDSNYDLISDTKLGTKSLSLEYVNALLDDIEYTEEYQTINNLLVGLFDDRLEEVDYYIKPNLECIITKKLLVKLIELSFLNDDSIINNYDLTLEERIMIQLNMVKQISLKSKKNILLFIECPIISKAIKDTLENMNTTSIVVFDKIIKDSYDDILILDDIRIDTSNENELYELCLNSTTSYYNIKEMKEKLINDYLTKRFI